MRWLRQLANRFFKLGGPAQREEEVEVLVKPTENMAVDLDKASPTVGIRVLLAEDNETIRDVMQEQLGMLGYACDVADNGRMALDMWQAGRYGLVLTDCHMPVMDGFALVAAIRAAEPPGVHVPVVAITGNAYEEEAQRCLAHGMDGYLRKPVRIQELSKMVDRCAPLRLLASDASAKADPDWQLAVLIEMVGSSSAMHYRLLQRFLVNTATQLQEMQAAAKSQQWGLVGDVGHKVKSSARTVGTLRLGELNQKLEDSVKEKKSDQYLLALVAEIGQAYEQVKPRLLQYCAEIAPQSPS